MQGVYEEIDDRPVLRFERHLGHPVDKVWHAVTEPEQLKHWFPTEVDLELRLGGRMKFTFPEQVPLEGVPPELEGEVTELDPPRRFSFKWGEDHLHFELEPEDTGCLLRLAVVLDSREKAARDGAGWHQCLDGLERLLSGDVEARPYESEDWRRYYDEYVQRGFPAGAPVPGQA
jgi:uncharacterized protein YndB with AHSA1/START domain